MLALAIVLQTTCPPHSPFSPWFSIVHVYMSMFKNYCTIVIYVADHFHRISVPISLILYGFCCSFFLPFVSVALVPQWSHQFWVNTCSLSLYIYNFSLSPPSLSPPLSLQHSLAIDTAMAAQTITTRLLVAEQALCFILFLTSHVCHFIDVG